MIEEPVDLIQHNARFSAASNVMRYHEGPQSAIDCVEPLWKIVQQQNDALDSKDREIEDLKEQLNGWHEGNTPL